MMGEVSNSTDDDPSYYEFKFRVPNNVNVIVDSTHSSWTGAINEPAINDGGSNLIFGVIYYQNLIKQNWKP